MRYNIVRIPCSDIKTDEKVLQPDLSPETVIVINTSTWAKFREMKVIPKHFKIAHNLILASKSGVDFLYHLLMIKHPRLSTIHLSTIDIALYSNKSCQYKYAKAIKNYTYVEVINGRYYTGQNGLYVPDPLRFRRVQDNKTDDRIKSGNNTRAHTCKI